tara:strand:+ start:35023 stop:35394 length:372 start_codon:yes stop_codon:yes gene_type:complete
MDITGLVTHESAECVIRHPQTNKPTDIKIKLYGLDSKRFREVSKLNAQTKLQEKAHGAETEDGPETDAAFFADLTVGWEGVEMDGKALPFTRENAIKVYTLSSPIRTQVNQFILRTANFLPKP